MGNNLYRDLLVFFCWSDPAYAVLAAIESRPERAVFYLVMAFLIRRHIARLDAAAVDDPG